MKRYSARWISQAAFPGNSLWGASSCKMLFESDLGITPVNGEGKNRIGKRKSQAAIQTQWQPQLTLCAPLELKRCFKQLFWDGQRESGLYTAPLLATGCGLTQGEAVALSMGPSRAEAIPEETKIYCWQPLLKLIQTSFICTTCNSRHQVTLGLDYLVWRVPSLKYLGEKKKRFS